MMTEGWGATLDVCIWVLGIHLLHRTGMEGTEWLFSIGKIVAVEDPLVGVQHHALLS